MPDREQIRFGTAIFAEAAVETRRPIPVSFVSRWEGVHRYDSGVE